MRGAGRTFWYTYPLTTAATSRGKNYLALESHHDCSGERAHVDAALLIDSEAILRMGEWVGGWVR